MDSAPSASHDAVVSRTPRPHGRAFTAPSYKISPAELSTVQEVAREVADLLEPKRQSRKPAVYRGLAATALAAAVSLAAWARGQLVAYGDERAAEAQARIERAERDRDLSDLARLAHETATANSARLDSLARQVDLLIAEVRADRADRAEKQRTRRR